MDLGRKKLIALLVIIFSGIFSLAAFLGFIFGAILFAGTPYVVFVILGDFAFLMVSFTALGLSISLFTIYHKVQRVYYHNEAALRQNLQDLSSKEGIPLYELEGVVLRSLLARSYEDEVRAVKGRWKDILGLCLENQLVSGRIDERRGMFYFTGVKSVPKKKAEGIDLNRYKKKGPGVAGEFDEYGQVKS